MWDNALKPIRLLPQQLANQIAAGEVVERPASVVKELVENSLDAGATQISVDIAEGGMRLIKVTDNGCGIPPKDLALAVSRHATSKIASLDDLLHINTLGFRGEALASIGAISNLKLTSRIKNDDHAWTLHCNSGQKQSKLLPAAHPVGTTIEVQDLFYNTPARRKFLRTEKTEFRHVDNNLRRLAMSCFDTGFILRHNQREVFRLPPIKDKHDKTRRVVRLWGKEFLEKSLDIEFSASGLHLSGWIGLPSFSRSQTDLQYFFLNGRIISDRLITHAIRQPYQDVIQHGRHPAYILFLSVDPISVDVNVHPTKQEVRFRETRLIHDFLSHSLHQALSGQQAKLISGTIAQNQIAEPIAVLPYRSNSSIALHAYKNATDVPLSATYDLQQPDSQTTLPLGQALGQLHKIHIVAQNAQGLVLVNIRAANEYLVRTRLKSAYDTQTIKSSPLLVPLNLPLEQKLVMLVENQPSTLQCLGFDISCSGPKEIMVRQIPALLRHADIPILIKGLLSALAKPQVLEPKEMNDLLAILAHLSQTPTPLPLSMAEMNTLLRELEDNSQDIEQNSQNLWLNLDLDTLQKMIARGH